MRHVASSARRATAASSLLPSSARANGAYDKRAGNRGALGRARRRRVAFFDRQANGASTNRGVGFFEEQRQRARYAMGAMSVAPDARRSVASQPATRPGNPAWPAASKRSAVIFSGSWRRCCSAIWRSGARCRRPTRVRARDAPRLCPECPADLSRFAAWWAQVVWRERRG